LGLNFIPGGFLQSLEEIHLFTMAGQALLLTYFYKSDRIIKLMKV